MRTSGGASFPASGESGMGVSGGQCNAPPGQRRSFHGNGQGPPGSFTGAMFATLLGRAVCLVLAGSALGLAVNAARPDGVRFSKFAPPTTCGAGEAALGAGAAPVEVLAPTAAVSVCGDAQTLVADVRPADEFAQG